MIPTNASAVENGKDASNDPNVVMIDGGYSGFLYSPRIVLTVAHGLEYGQTKDAVRRIEYPGQIATYGTFPTTNYIETVKIFWAPNYQSRTSTNWARIDDFAVMVLARPMEMKNKVRIANAEDIKKYLDNNTPVKMIGYGRQKDRRLSGFENNFPITPNELTSRILSEQESNLIKRGLPSGVSFTSDVNFQQIAGQGSVCDGDSGAGWFVEENGYRNYIGGVSSGWGNPNCGKDGIWDFNGALAGVSAAYRFMDLIAEAERYVEEHPYIDTTAKMITPSTPVAQPSPTPIIVISKAKIVPKILCQKGKTKKYYVSIKCPKGYKLIKKIA